MTNNEVNRYIHEEIMGLCWHDDPLGDLICAKCGERDCSGYFEWERPNYTSSLDAIRPVVIKLVELDESLFYAELVKVFSDTKWKPNRELFPMYFLLAEPRQLAVVCVNAHKELKNDS